MIKNDDPTRRHEKYVVKTMLFVRKEPLEQVHAGAKQGWGHRVWSFHFLYLNIREKVVLLTGVSAGKIIVRLNTGHRSASLTIVARLRECAAPPILRMD